MYRGSVYKHGVLFARTSMLCLFSLLSRAFALFLDELRDRILDLLVRETYERRFD